MDWMLLAAFIIAFFFDNVIIAYWSYHRATKKARDLIINDPEFTAVRAEIDAIQVKLDNHREDVLTQVESALVNANRDVLEGVQGLVSSQDLTLSPTTERALQSSLQASLRQQTKGLVDELKEDIKGIYDQDPQVQLEVAEAEMQMELIAQQLREMGVPELVIQIGAKYGPFVLKNMIIRSYPDIAEEVFAFD